MRWRRNEKAVRLQIRYGVNMGVNCPTGSCPRALAPQQPPASCLHVAAAAMLVRWKGVAWWGATGVSAAAASHEAAHRVTAAHPNTCLYAGSPPDADRATNGPAQPTVTARMTR